MARTDGNATTLDQGFVSRVAAGMGAFVSAYRGQAQWFGPGEPMRPALDEQQAQQAGAAGRQMDYVTGLNTQTQPRAGEAINFGILRALADNFDLLRLVIETRKDQVCSLPWAIVPRDEKKKPDARCAEAEALLRCPDGESDWPTWLRMVLEDLFVLDAPAVYVRRSLGGDALGFEPIDGATIKRLIDPTGRTPADGPAYQQVIKGVPAVDYTREDLIYRPRNRRTHKVYGFGPVEQIINTVNVALRRQGMTSSYFTDGTVPDALAGVPESWTIDQINAFQVYWDQLLASEDGQMGQRRKLKFVPGEIAKNFKETKAPPLKDSFDEWLARVVCYCFAIDVTPFVAQVNRSVAETNREQSLAEGLGPVKIWIEGLVSRILQLLGFDDLKLTWPEGEIVDPVKRQQVICGYVTAKVLHPDEGRASIGYDPMTPEQRADLFPPAPVIAGPGEEGDPDELEGEGMDDDTAEGKTADKVRKRHPVEIHNHITLPDVVVDVGATTVHAHLGEATDTRIVERSSAEN